LTSIFAKDSKLDLTNDKPVDDLTFMQAFKMGFLTNILNPKVTLFFLSLFTFVISPSTPTYIVLFLSFIMVATAFIWFTIVSIFFTQQKVQKAFLRFEKPINRFMGSLLVLLGVKIALTFK
jgi:threonine/homoserine/homoserine lactone efflux protein